MSAITDRRGVLYRLPTARAAEAAAPIPSTAATEEPDAIFGLIGAHKAAWAQFMELDDAITKRLKTADKPRTPR